MKLVQKKSVLAVIVAVTGNLTTKQGPKGLCFLFCKLCYLDSFYVARYCLLSPYLHTTQAKPRELLESDSNIKVSPAKLETKCYNANICNYLIWAGNNTYEDRIQSCLVI